MEDRKILIAWLETEGSFSIYFDRRKGFNPRLYIQIAQKDRKPLERIKQEMGIGQIVKNNSKCWVLRWRDIKDLKYILSYILQDDNDWYTNKLEKAKASFELINFRSKFTNGHRWLPEEKEFVINLCKKISPKSKQIGKYDSRVWLQKIKGVQGVQGGDLEHSNIINGRSKYYDIINDYMYTLTTLTTLVETGEKDEKKPKGENPEMHTLEFEDKKQEEFKNRKMFKISKDVLIGKE